MPIVWIAPYGNTPTVGSGWVSQQTEGGTLIRTYITTSGTSATTVYPWQYVDFGTTSATTSTYTTWVPYFEDNLQWAPSARVQAPERAQVQSPAIIRQRAEAQAQYEEEQARHAQQMREAQARAVEARTRAHALLLEHLTPEQRRTFEANNWFVVDGKSGVKYRVNGRSYTGNVEVLNRDRVSHRLCGHCSSDIPFHDQLLAQKFMLEHAEDEFVRIANRHPA